MGPGTGLDILDILSEMELKPRSSSRLPSHCTDRATPTPMMTKVKIKNSIHRVLQTRRNVLTASRVLEKLIRY